MVNPLFIRLLAFFLLGTTMGCGDGIGRPLREDPGAQGWGGSGFGGSGFGDQGGVGLLSPFDASTNTDGDVPTGEYCATVDVWPLQAVVAEEGIVNGLNTARSLGVGCDSSAAPFPAAPNVAMTAELRCSARLHAHDMFVRGFVDDLNPDMEGPDVRIARTGYISRVEAEVVAAGDLPPYAILEQLLSADSPDCATLMNPQFTAAGVGEYEGLWAIDLAGP